MQIMSTIRKDFVVSNVRSQAVRLNLLLENMEEQTDFDYDYTLGSLKEIERSLRNIRELCANN